MKCPYDPNYTTIIKANKPDILEYEPSNDKLEPTYIVNNDQTQMTVHHYRDCIHEECAAWQDGRCVRIS